MAEEIKDVKNATETSTVAPVESKTETAQAEGQDEAFVPEEKRSIPYPRFKEVLETKKDLERKIKQMEKTVEEKVAETARQYQTYYESELAKVSRAKQADPYQEIEEVGTTASPYVDRELVTLKDEIKALKSDLIGFKTQAETKDLQARIAQLKDVYPSLDEEHVYVVKKMKPDLSLEECAEYSHKKFEDAVKDRYNKVMEKKREAAKKPVLVEGERFVLKPEEKPKSFKDAKKRLMEHMRQFEK